MKQISPNYPLAPVRETPPCIGKSVFIWGAYGWLMTCLWGVARGNSWAEAAAWAAALGAGLALAIATREV